MFRSTPLRIGFAAALACFAWLMLSTWRTDTPSVRGASSMMAALALLVAVGIAAPTRGRIALRIGAGVIGTAYVVYFAVELWQLLRGESQRLRPGEPSALMAGIGLLVYAVPMLIFAVAGYPGERYRSLADFFKGKTDDERAGPAG